MPITIVVGGQFGSEGKGKIAHWLASKQQARIAIRVGGANSGHTAYSGADKYVLRQLPTPVLHDKTIAALAAGAYINLEVLLAEISEIGLDSNRVWIHPEAVVVDGTFRQAEARLGLVERIGSTGQGVGAAVAARALRDPRIVFARDVPALSGYVRADLPQLIDRALSGGERILLEGTQGFGLSLLHSQHYPFCTSRDTTAAGVLAEVGLSPMDVDCVALVVRAFPIRVAGRSGPLPLETNWEELKRQCGANGPIEERTTVTNNIRRVGFFDATIVEGAIIANHPTFVCLNHVDYLDYSIHSRRHISSTAARQVWNIEQKLKTTINYVGTGPNTLVERPSLGWNSLRAA